MTPKITVDDCLEIAIEWTGYAEQAIDKDKVDHERVMRTSAVAQAHALTTIAMILAAWWTERQADNDREELRATQDYEIPGWREGRPSADAPF